MVTPRKCHTGCNSLTTLDGGAEAEEDGQGEGAHAGVLVPPLGGVVAELMDRVGLGLGLYYVLLGTERHGVARGKARCRCGVWVRWEMEMQ